MWSAAVLLPAFPGPEQHRERLAGPVGAVVGEGPQRVMAVAALERRPRVLLIGVRGHERRVDIDDQRRLRARPMVGGVLAGELPDPGPGGGPGGVDRREGPRGVGGERVDRAGHGRVGRDGPVHAGRFS